MKVNYTILTPYILLLLLSVTGVISWIACLWAVIAWIIISVVIIIVTMVKQRNKEAKYRKFWRDFYNERDEHNMYNDEQA